MLYTGNGVTLLKILKFITGQSKVPPRGLAHKIKLGYHNDSKKLPTAECCFSILNLPVVHMSFEEFARSMDEAVVGSGDRFLRE